MIHFIRGTLHLATPIFVVMETNGIGYKIFIPLHLLGNLPEKGASLLLHTSFVIREMSQALYGFLEESERDLFDVLLNVSGVGPKMALSLIGHLSPDELRHAVLNQDYAKMCKVPGVGKKTAERLTIELRDKLPTFNEAHLLNKKDNILLSAKDQLSNDAVSALINLGYSPIIANKAIKKAKEECPQADLATLIMEALKRV